MTDEALKLNNRLITLNNVW